MKKSDATAEILPTHTPGLFQKAVTRAAAHLRGGELVVLPTETVYGLAANALDARAVSRIFEAKDRPAHNPIIVHVASLEMARACCRDWPAAADRLSSAFWPGPLTLVLPRAAAIPDIVTAGGGTVGIRWPSHPFIQAVIRECGFPLAAPSANPANQVSPTNAAHVRKSLGSRVGLIVDGGQSQVGIESTVIDLTRRDPTVLRPGMIHLESLTAALGSEKIGAAAGGESGILRSPGQLKKHYSPKAKVVALEWENESSLRAQIMELKLKCRLNRVHVIAHTHIPTGDDFGGISVIPHDAEAFARAIYAEFHHCDESGAECIVVEALPPTPEWHGIADRIVRAQGAG